MRPAILLALCFLLSACAESSRSIDIAAAPKPPQLADVDKKLWRDCPEPIVVQEKDMSADEVEEAWKADRASLLKCRWRANAYRAGIVDRDRRFRGDIVR